MLRVLDVVLCSLQLVMVVNKMDADYYRITDRLHLHLLFASREDLARQMAFAGTVSQTGRLISCGSETQHNKRAETGNIIHHVSSLPSALDHRPCSGVIIACSWSLASVACYRYLPTCRHGFKSSVMLFPMWHLPNIIPY